jgi:hypothetical protein
VRQSRRVAFIKELERLQAIFDIESVWPYSSSAKDVTFPCECAKMTAGMRSEEVTSDFVATHCQILLLRRSRQRLCGYVATTIAT